MIYQVWNNLKNFVKDTKISGVITKDVDAAHLKKISMAWVISVIGDYGN